MTNETLSPKSRGLKKKLGEVQRLMDFMEDQNLKPIDIATKCQISDRTITNAIYENKELGSILLRKIHLNYGVSLDWLISGVGGMYLRNAVAETAESYSVTGDLSEVIHKIDEWMLQATPEESIWLKIEIRRLLQNNFPPVIR
jgi:hypothetical protein